MLVFLQMQTALVNKDFDLCLGLEHIEFIFQTLRHSQNAHYHITTPLPYRAISAPQIFVFDNMARLGHIELHMGMGGGGYFSHSYASSVTLYVIWPVCMYFVIRLILIISKNKKITG